MKNLNRFTALTVVFTCSVYFFGIGIEYRLVAQAVTQVPATPFPIAPTTPPLSPPSNVPIPSLSGLPTPGQTPPDLPPSTAFPRTIPVAPPEPVYNTPPYPISPGTFPPSVWRPEDPTILRLLLEYLQTEEVSKKKQIAIQVSHLVQQQFEANQSNHQKEIEVLERELLRRKKLHEKRNSLQSKIISDRVNQLIQQAEGIGWEVSMPRLAPRNPATPETTLPPATPLSWSVPPSRIVPPPPTISTGESLTPPTSPLGASTVGDSQPPEPTVANYPKARVSYEDFKQLVEEVELHRKDRLVSLDQFIEMSKRPNVVILDTRSAFRYDRIHIKGAKHLSFTDFTQANLAETIPSKDTVVLIYCNNNFDGNQVDFASKSAPPRPRASRSLTSQIASQEKPVQLALNVPTYINLFGYGYQNVYELGELVKVSDPRIEFEGSIVGAK